MAAAEASFKTSIDSMSFILMELKGDTFCPVPFPASPDMGKPSTTYNGSVPAVILPLPLTLIDNPPPGIPFGCETCTPVILPTSA